MDKKIIEQEKLYLENTIKEIDSIREIDMKKIKSNENSIAKFKNYFAENYYDIKTDSDELAEVNLQIENLEQQNLSLEKEDRRLLKQRKNPYFGRFDFKTAQDTAPKPYYIGLGLVQNGENENLVYDWRADICSLYYDDVSGKASYLCPEGEIKGELSLKRQFKIEKGAIKYFIDNQMVIDDDILMEQLSKNATSKMHDIVSTIQKEQNILIRADDFENTIVQGVAGSGKHQ